MQQLLEMYSVQEILIFIIALALAIKGIITFFDWAIDRLRKVFNKEHAQTDEKEQVQKSLADNQAAITKLDTTQKEMKKSINALTDKIDMLVDSDRDDIKSFITREHHYFCYQKGWIDDYSLDCCERRYAHYVKEKGNSFIEAFMNDLRALPKQPPQT